MSASLILGVADDTTTRAFRATAQGHLESEIHGPLGVVSGIETTSLTPIVQQSAVYGLNTDQITTSTLLSGSAAATNQLFTCKTGTTQFGYGVIQSRERAVYHSGQGIRTLLSAAFTTGVANSSQIAGYGSAEAGIYVGYLNADFGLYYTTNGRRAIVTLTINTASSTAENVTITLNGVPNTIAVTASGNIQRSVWELAQGTYNGWTVTPSGATLIFVMGAASPVTIGNFSITATTLAGTYALTQDGSVATTTFYAQDDWNNDPLNGTGASGVTLNPSKINLYQIDTVLSGGALTLSVDISPESGVNNPTMALAHVVPIANTLTGLNMTNASGPITIAAYSAGSTTDLTVTCGSMSAFHDGELRLTGNRYSYDRTLSATVTTALYPLFILHNTRSYKSRANQGVIRILSWSGALKHTQPGLFKMLRSTQLGQITVAGNPNFAQFSSNAITYIDIASTAVTLTNNSQVVATQALAETSSFQKTFNDEERITLQPGEYLAVCGITTSGTANTASVAVTWREDF